MGNQPNNGGKLWKCDTVSSYLILTKFCDGSNITMGPSTKEFWQCTCSTFEHVIEPHLVFIVNTLRRGCQNESRVEHIGKIDLWTLHDYLSLEDAILL